MDHRPMSPAERAVVARELARLEGRAARLRKLSVPELDEDTSAILDDYEREQRAIGGLRALLG